MLPPEGGLRGPRRLVLRRSFSTMDIRKIKKMIELLEESGIAEIEIKEGEESLRIARALPASQPTMTYVTAPPPASGVGANAATPVAPAVAAPASGPADAGPLRAGVGEHVVSAPMVGTYYSAPTPGAKQFVEIGDEVEVGQVLCVIEAMKMMNQIESEKAGKIKAILIKNGELVGFGQSLFIIQPLNDDDRKNRHRQPWRNCPAHTARLPRAGHQNRCRAFHGGRESQACAAGRRVGLHRAAALGTELPEHACHHQRGGSDRLGRDSSGVWFSVRERRLRRA